MNRELPDIQDDTSLMAKSEEKPKSLLMTVKDESEKVGLNATLKKKTNKLGSWQLVHIASWQIDGGKWKQ